MESEQYRIVVRADDQSFQNSIFDLRYYKSLTYYLALRDIQIRYKQTALGVAWAVFQPVLTMIIFTVIFSYFLGVESEEIPYPVMTYAALLPWIYFAGSIAKGSDCLVVNFILLQRVYFPRMVLPIAAVLVPLLDLGLSFVVLMILMAIYGIVPTVGIVLLPVFVLLALMTALGVSLWLSALNVRYRDIRHITPFLVQSWMYITPIIYPIDLVPQNLRLIYSLNPMVSVVEGFRWALLGTSAPNPLLMLASTLVILSIFVSGAIYFLKAERSFADVI